MICGKGCVVDLNATPKEVRFCHIDTEDGTHEGKHRSIYMGKVLTWEDGEAKIES